LIAAAVDGGINFFDTADMYSQGESESLLGRAFRGRRNQVVIATKAGWRLPARRLLAARIKPLLRPLVRRLGLRREKLSAAIRGEPDQDFTPRYLRTALEASLRRLRTDHVDLFQLHSPPAATVERGEWIGALEDLRREGKLRYYGVSCDTEEAAQAAFRHRGIASVQIAVNLLERRAAEAVLPAAAEAKVGVIARECLANGLLAKEGAALDLGRYCSNPEERERRAKQLDSYARIASANGCTLRQLALQYVSSLEGVSVALVGASSADQLRDCLQQLARPQAPPGAFRPAAGA